MTVLRVETTASLAVSGCRTAVTVETLAAAQRWSYHDSSGCTTSAILQVQDLYDRRSIFRSLLLRSVVTFYPGKRCWEGVATRWPWTRAATLPTTIR